MTESDIKIRFIKHLNEYKKVGINKYNFIKHSGWFVLNREHSYVLLDNKNIFKYFNKVKAGDENFLSILKVHNMKLTEKVVTCVEWDKFAYDNYKKQSSKLWQKYDKETDEIKKKKIESLISKKRLEMLDKTSHPKTYSKITKKDLQEFKCKDCLFVRKIDKNTNVSILL